MSAAPSRVVILRSIFRGRLLYSVPGWLLEETPTHVVTATVPGAQTLQPLGPRASVVREVARGRERIGAVPWHTNRVVWLTPFGAAHALGHFWNDASGEFLGYYVNLQAPLRPTPLGYDSFDHVLDVVVKPDGTWQWKDEDEFVEAVDLGIFTPSEAAAIRSEGERVIASLPALIPTGWEAWRPGASWSARTLTLPDNVRDGLA
jgi:hypothetical protein